MKGTFKNKITAALVLLTMMLSMLPGAAYAEGITADYYPYAPSAYSYKGDGTAICLNWRNPVTAPTAIEVYDITNPNSPVLKKSSANEDVDLTADKGQAVIIEGLTAGTTYTYKVEFTYADGNKTSTVLSQKAETLPLSDPHRQLKNGWTWLMSDNGKRAEFSIVFDEKNSGNASLHIVNNWSGSGQTADSQIRIFGVSPAAGTSYVLTGAYKTNKYKGEYYSGDLAGGAMGLSLQEDAQEWTDFTSADISASWNAGWPVFSLFLPKFYSKDLWLDDIKLCAKGTDTSIISGGNFENVTAAATPSASAATTGKTTNVSLVPGADSDLIYIYETIGGVDVTRAVVKADTENVALDNVANASALKVAAKNGSYVMSQKAAVSKISDADYYTYSPMMNSYTETSMIISWRNPNKKPSKVSLYDITNPANPVLIKDDFNTTARKAQYTIVEGLTSGNVYSYKIVCDFTAHASTSSFLTGKTGTYKSNPISGTNFVTAAEPTTVASTTAGYTLPEIYIDTNTTANNSNGSLYISSNFSANGTELRYDCTGTNGDIFTATMDTKGNEYCQSVWYPISVFGGPCAGFIKDAANGNEKTYDWFKYTVNSQNSNGYGRIIIPTNMIARDFWLDNITLKNTTTNSDNILTGCNFEQFIPALEVSNVTSSNAVDTQATISFKRNADTQKVFVYRVIDGNEVLVAKVSDANDVTIDGLKSGEENKIVVKNLDTNHVLSAGTTIKVIPTVSKISTGDYKLYSGTTSATVVTAGEMTVKLDITNNENGANFKPCFIVALYNGTEMVAIDVADDVTIAEGDTKTLSAKVTVPTIVEGDNYKIKAFLWNDFDGMGILKDHIEF